MIAAVNGPCVGGGLALCLAADIRLCSTAASFGNAAILLGLSGAEMGMSYHLPRIVGTSVAADWMITGRTVAAEEADRRGLVSELVEPSALVERASSWPRRSPTLSPLGVRMTKRALQVNTDAPDLARRARAREPQPGDHARHRRGRRRPAALDRGAMTGPLAGIRIVMMGGLGPGPFCAMVLGDLGADVVRVDQRPRGRRAGPHRPRGAPQPTLDRRSTSRTSGARSSCHRLVEGADAFVDVFGPGVIERLGIGPDDLLDRNPRLVYARMTGYGQDGPMARWPATTSTTSRCPARSTPSAPPRHPCRRSTWSATTAAAACCWPSDC